MRLFLSFDPAPHYLRHILDAIGAIQDFTEGQAFDDFADDPKTVAAVERMLLVISEAGKRLGIHGEKLCPDVPWHKVRGVGNWLRHQYDRIDVRMIWDTVIEDLPPLKRAVAEALARLTCAQDGGAD